MKRVVFLSILAFALSSFAAQAQKKMGRYHKNLLYEADLYLVQGDYYYSAELYEELLRVSPKNAEINGKLGICYYNLPTMKPQAREALERAVDGGDTEALYYLAKLKHEDYLFYDALELLERYERRPSREKTAAEIERAKEISKRASVLVKDPLLVKIENLGPGVNSSAHDYAPVWDMSGDRIYFTSRRRFDDKSEKDFTEQFDENIYVINLEEESLEARPALGSINSRSNDAAVACSHDGNELIVYRTSKDGFSGDLYKAVHTEDGWGKLEKLSEKINSRYQEASASYGGPEQNVLYFSSDRPGGYGGKDIYKVQQLPDGTWSEPFNLGPTINTPYDEDAPFIAADGTLYFASKGHDNMGGFDIFSARPLTGGYSEPVNLGYPINTPADDIFFSIEPQGKQAYFSSDRKGGYGLQDIYTVHLNLDETIIYRGKLLSMGMPVKSRATVTLIEKQGVENRVLFQVETGKSEFILALDAEKAYTVEVEADGYGQSTRDLHFELPVSGTKEVVEDIELSRK